VTANGEVYTVQCLDSNGDPKPIKGNTVIIRQNTTYTALQLANVEVYGDDNCNVDERLHALGPSKCTTSSDCSGERTCSRWKWCQGVSNCPAPAVAPGAIRATYLSSLYKESFTCGETDSENYFKEVDEGNTNEKCAELIQEAGFEFYEQIMTSGCRGCINDS